MDIQTARTILQRYASGDCTAAETKLVEQWYRRLLETGEWAWEDGERDMMEAAMRARLLNAIDQPLRRLRLIRRIAAAAAVVIGLGLTWLLLLKPAADIMPAMTAILPGGQKAVLTLADGTTVALDSSGTQTIRHGIRRQQGQLQYEASATVSLNTLTTPRGGQFSIRLPDGSQAWLNASSTLKYPTAFKGDERVVEMTGEVYFEISPDAQRPFRVKVNGQPDIEVLGTAFNVNAYTNEAYMSTTLLDGSVRIQGIILQPGQQLNGRKLVQADVHKATAWKNNLFNFENASLPEVMRQIERWYDITVVYEKGIPDIEFVGKMPRNISLSALLNSLGKVGVRFRMESNRRLVVTK